MAATGIVRYIRKDLDDTLGNIMAAEAYAYGASIAALYISHLDGKGEAFLIVQAAQLFRRQWMGSSKPLPEMPLQKEP